MGGTAFWLFGTVVPGALLRCLGRFFLEEGVQIAYSMAYFCFGGLM